MLSETLAKALVKAGANELKAGASAAPGRTLSDIAEERAPREVTTEFDSVLDGLIRRARFITGADGAALALGDAGKVVCRATCGHAPELGVKLDPRSGLCGRCFSNSEPIMWSACEESAATYGVCSVLAIPIRVATASKGLIAAFSRSPQAFTAEHLAALARIADVVTQQLSLTRLDTRPSAPNMAVASSRPPVNSATSTGTPANRLVHAMPQAKTGSHGDPVVAGVSGTESAAANAATKMPGTVKVLPKKLLGAVSASGKSNAESKEKPEVHRIVAEDVRVSNIPFVFGSVEPAEGSYVVPIVTAIILTILVGILLALDWRAEQMENPTPAHQIAVPARDTGPGSQEGREAAPPSQ